MSKSIKSPRSSPSSNVRTIRPAAELQLLMAATVTDALKRRGQSGRLGKQYGDKRDLYNVLGYLHTPSVEDYWQMYLRQDLASRIINAPADATWSEAPEIVEDDNPDTETAFEKAVQILVKKLRLWSYMQRADRLSGVGFYGILLLGVKGDLASPIAAGAFRKPEDLMFCSVFSNRHAVVKDFVIDTQDPRYGKPANYMVDLKGDLSSSKARNQVTTRNQLSKDSLVDASRAIHFAEELTEDDTHGTPRLERVVNRLFDLEKVAGGSAEMYWRGAYGGFALSVADDAGSAFASSGEVDPAVVDEFAHGMRRWIDLEGYKLEQLQGQDVKPKEVFDMLIGLVSAATGIPSRILMGSERGELASSQDERNWNSQIKDRRENYANPIIRDLIDRMISWGIVPAPKGEYEIKWPELGQPTDTEKAQVFKTYAEGISQVAPAGSPELVMTPGEIRTRFLDLEAEPAADLVMPPSPTPEPAPAAPPAPRRQ
jgi:hypothetical protein